MNILKNITVDQIGYILLIISSLMLLFIIVSIWRNCRKGHIVYSIFLAIPFLMSISTIGIIYMAIDYSKNNPIKESVILGNLSSVDKQKYATTLETTDNYHVEIDKNCNINSELKGVVLNINIHEHGDHYLSYEYLGKSIECKLITYKKKEIK